MKINATNSANGFGGRLRVSNTSNASKLDGNVELIAKTPQTFEALEEALKRIDDEAKKHKGKLPYYGTEDLNLQFEWVGSFSDHMGFMVTCRKDNGIEYKLKEKTLQVNATEGEKIQHIKEFADTVCYKMSGKQGKDAEKILDLYA